ncbi:hypothetical protein PGTUg99_017264 [Puccinia graminis f. sp. tritici]|nr:hypothetical protein PGTUg99_017264 [Puccinia graminis f. sp. tritici]
MFHTVNRTGRMLSLCFVLWALVSVVSSALPESLLTCPRCHKETLAPLVLGSTPDAPACVEPVFCKNNHEIARGCGAPKSLYVKSCTNKVRKGLTRTKVPCGYMGEPFYTCGAPNLHSGRPCRCPPGGSSGSQSGWDSQSGWGSSSSWS